MGRIDNAKDCGGLGFTNIRLMDECLLAKWIMRLEGRFVLQSIKKKYLKGKGFFSSNARGGISFGKVYMR
jgi:hypothetical protein